MENTLLILFGVTGAVWLLGLFLCIAALQILLRPPPRSLRKALCLSVAAVVVCGVGSLVRIYLAVSTHVEGEANPPNVVNWNYDSVWFFRPLLIVASVALILAVSQWFRAPKNA
jgi:hypothetical protein